MAARVSDTAGAAFAVTIQISQTLFLLFRIIGSGIGVVIKQNLGGGRRGGACGCNKGARKLIEFLMNFG